MKSSSEYRSAAWSALSGKWGSTAVSYLVYGVVSIAISCVIGAIVPVVGSLCGTLVALPITFGFVVGMLRQLRGEDFQIGWLFENFNGRVWLTLILQSLYTALWSLLLVIPGIIKSYSYAMTSFIMHDDAEIKNDAAIEKSMAMMDGHKMDLFILDLTFIGWYILGFISFGIGLLWVVPYHRTALAAFYEDLKAA